MATDHCWNWQVGSERCNFTALCGTFLLFKRPSSQLHLFSSSRSFSILSYPLFSTLRPLALHSAHRENITLMWYDMCVPTVYSCKKNCSCHVFFFSFFFSTRFSRWPVWTWAGLQCFQHFFFPHRYLRSQICLDRKAQKHPKTSTTVFIYKHF